MKIKEPEGFGNKQQKKGRKAGGEWRGSDRIGRLPRRGAAREARGHKLSASPACLSAAAACLGCTDVVNPGILCRQRQQQRVRGAGQQRGRRRRGAR